MFRIPGQHPDQKKTIVLGSNKTQGSLTIDRTHHKNTAQDLTPNHIRNTRINLLSPSKDIGEFIAESKKIIQIFHKDLDIIIFALDNKKPFPDHILLKHYHALRNFRHKVLDAALRTKSHSSEERSIKQIQNILSTLHKDIRQLLVISQNTREETRLKKIIDRKNPPHTHHRNELFTILETRGERIINHLYHYSPLAKESASIEENILAHDLDIYKKIYSSLILSYSKEKLFSIDEEKRLLLHVYKFNQQIRHVLYYILGHLPKDLNYDHEKNYIEKPSPAFEELQRCPITGVLGEKKDFDVHHKTKQSHLYGSMKENITYILKDFHVFYHTLTDNKELEEPIIRVKNILSIQQGLSIEEFTKISSPLMKIESLISEKRKTIPNKSTGKFGQLISAHWKIASGIHRLHLLPSPVDTPGEKLHLLCINTLELIHGHLEYLLEKYGKNTKSQISKEDASKKLEEYLFNSKGEKKLSQKELLETIHIFRKETSHKLQNGFHPDHPLISDDELGWYGISVYKLFCDIIRTFLMDAPNLLERKLLYKLHGQVDTFQQIFIELISHIQSQPKDQNYGGYRSKLTSIIQKEHTLYEFITKRLFIEHADVKELEKNSIPESIKEFVLREKRNIPHYLKNYREQLLLNGIPNTLLYNIHIIHKDGHEKENGAFQLHSLGRAQKEKNFKL